MKRWIAHIAGRWLSRHAHEQRRASVKDRARQMREELGLKPLRALK